MLRDSCLVILELEDNFIFDIGAKYLCEGLKVNTKLQVLSMECHGDIEVILQ